MTRKNFVERAEFNFVVGFLKVFYLGTKREYDLRQNWSGTLGAEQNISYPTSTSGIIILLETIQNIDYLNFAGGIL